MAIATYTDLKSSVSNWLARSDLGGNAADFIMLAEAGLNREINPVEIDVMLAGTTGSREIDVSGQSVVEALALFLAENGRNEIPVARKEAGSFPYREISGCPSFWAMDGAKIKFDRELDTAYPFRFRFRQKFALSDSAPTNWLLTNHPDLYLAATLIWGGIFTENDPQAARWATILNRALPSVRNIIAQANRSTLTVDTALARAGVRRFILSSELGVL